MHMDIYISQLLIISIVSLSFVFCRNESLHCHAVLLLSHVHIAKPNRWCNFILMSKIFSGLPLSTRCKNSDMLPREHGSRSCDVKVDKFEPTWTGTDEGHIPPVRSLQAPANCAT